MIRADALNALLDPTGGLADESFFDTLTFLPLAFCDHPSVS
jgi:hypothetical protein